MSARIIPLPETFASERTWAIPEAIEIAEYPLLSSAWEFSRRQLRSIREALGKEKLPAEVETVALVGSLGRMEASEVSDCDLIVILDDDAWRRTGIAEHAYAEVWRALEPLRLPAPRTDGIYARPSSRSRLLDPRSLGQVAEDVHSFGTRIQFLLEAQPVYRADAFERLTNDIVDRYALEFVSVDPRKEWTYLLNDLIRYFRSLCIAYQWESLDVHGMWRLRNLKARHSRLIMYAGLLLLLGECSRERQDKVAWLKRRLKLTPLERIAIAYAVHGDPDFPRVARCCETFLEAIGSPDFRSALAADDRPGSPLARESNPGYAELKRNGDALLAELLRFLLERRHDWSLRFFEYLIF